MHSRQLEQALNQSNIILCRSGYTSIMDLSKLNKKAFFIPTPGQYEQEYLAKKLKKKALLLLQIKTISLLIILMKFQTTKDSLKLNQI